jgi:hypothetical protein
MITPSDTQNTRKPYTSAASQAGNPSASNQRTNLPRVNSSENGLGSVNHTLLGKPSPVQFSGADSCDFPSIDGKSAKLATVPAPETGVSDVQKDSFTPSLEESLHVDPVITPAHSASTPPVSAQSGFLSSYKAFRDYMNHGSNREILKAFTYKYAPELLLSVSFMVPFGWIPGIFGIVPAWMMSRKGEKHLQSLVNSGALEKTRGPLARASELSGYWDAVTDSGKSAKELAHIPHRFTETYNKLLQDLFPENEAHGANILRDKFSIHPDGKAFKTLQHLFLARQNYFHSWTSKILTPVRKLGDMLHFRPIKLICSIPDFLAMTVMSLLEHGKIREMAVQAARHI